ncbi:hypothetical protein I302_105788 [Kwoniella bestiolae CBS 10118]|uniref:Uncharacterized protein n=1 Tax=Kwoniella bestiolae CBS 10118 TaxID=1296100 RepID=A0A1B9G255_9TREE|nr:hypothetical protein I302_04909 [Kwoniella bestiolae CBS 10118]OCF25099.1 hypothetical protein I302_04909 [Kwoniella bestiolae CBS 10118]
MSSDANSSSVKSVKFGYDSIDEQGIIEHRTVIVTPDNEGTYTVIDNGPSLKVTTYRRTSEDILSGNMGKNLDKGYKDCNPDEGNTTEVSERASENARNSGAGDATGSLYQDTNDHVERRNSQGTGADTRISGHNDVHDGQLSTHTNSLSTGDSRIPDQRPNSSSGWRKWLGSG